ncbi:MAG: SDR family oxidoreductase [Candidatus Micrarchaeota archaeon]|nr:SDR family oxidoreductase [Candidatus Micrarchaeota archaeon]
MPSSNDYLGQLFNIKGQVAVVTGADTKLGRIFSEILVSQGAIVIVCDEDHEGTVILAEELSRKYKTKVYSFHANLIKEHDAKELFYYVYHRFGRVDILVNNARVLGSEFAKKGKRFSALNTTDELWDKIIEQNLSVSFTVIKSAAKYMLKQGSGKIINVSSVYGIFIDTTDQIPLAAYDTSTGGMITLTRELAVEFAAGGVCVNALAPTYIITKDGVKKNKLLNHWKRLTPMRRLGYPSDLVGATLFLSSGASSFITGEVLSVDGGWAAKGTT